MKLGLLKITESNVQDIALRDFEQALTINVTGPNMQEKVEKIK